jgi:D-aspartate ligase
MNKVFILGAHINALGIVRSFQNTDIETVVYNDTKELAAYSRYTTFKACPNPNEKEALLNYFVAACSQEVEAPIVFPTSDVYLSFLIENQEALSGICHIPFSDAEILDGLLRKEILYPWAQKIGVSCPKTAVVSQEKDFYKIKETLELPLIVKPSLNKNFTSCFREKALKIENWDEFEDIKLKAIKNKVLDDVLIFQEFIPGNVEDLYTITSYADKNNDIIGYSIGHKIRQNPPETGTIISGRLKHEDEILSQTRLFLKNTKFYGISNVEFKKDGRNGTFKLMEINPRSGSWNLSALRSGVNLPLMAYRDILGMPISEAKNHKANFVWIINPLDMYFALWGFKKNGFPAFKISYLKWRKSVAGKKVDATFEWKDPMPFLRGLFTKFS